MIVSRIRINEYEYDDFENIKFDELNNKLSFFGNSGFRTFRISNNNIYGFDQSEQISKLKEFVNRIHNKVC